MVTRVTRLEASRLLKISPSTVDRRIERGELTVEKEVHGSRNRIWVVLEDADLEVPSEVPGKVSPENLPESHLEEVIILRERVKSLESLDEYHRGQLVQKDLLVQELMGTVNRLATALPEGKRPAESVQRMVALAVASERVARGFLSGLLLPCQEDVDLAAAAPGQALPGLGVAAAGYFEATLRAVHGPVKLQLGLFHLRLLAGIVSVRRFGIRPLGWLGLHWWRFGLWRGVCLVQGGFLLPGESFCGLWSGPVASFCWSLVLRIVLSTWLTLACSRSWRFPRCFMWYRVSVVNIGGGSPESAAGWWGLRPGGRPPAW